MFPSLPKYSKYKEKLLRSNNIKNAYWSVADVIIYPLLLLVTTPLFLKELGPELYGVWMLVNSIIASIGVLNAGLGEATINFISKYRALQDQVKIYNVFRATYSLTIAVFFVVVSLVLLGADAIVYSGLFKISDIYKQQAVAALQIASVAFSLKLIEQIFFAYFKAYERFDIFSKISIITRAAALMAGAGLVLAGYSLTAILLSNVVATVFSLIIEVILISKKLGFKAFVPHYDKQTVREVFGFSAYAWLQTIIGVLAAQMDRYIVAAAVSMEVLAYYSIGLLVANQIHNVFSAGSSFIFPLISKKIQQRDEIKYIYFRMQLVVISAALFCICALVMIEKPLFTLWLGERNYELAHEFIQLFLCYEALLVTSVIPYYYMIGSGHIKLNTVIMALSTLATAVAMVVLFYFMGQNGLIWGKILSIALTSPFLYNLLHKRVLHDKSKTAGIKLLLPSCAAIVFIIAPYIWVKVLAILICSYLLYTIFYRKVKPKDKVPQTI